MLGIASMREWPAYAAFLSISLLSYTSLHIILLLRSWRILGGRREVYSQLASVHHLLTEELLGLLSTRYINEVGVCKATWLSTAAINGNSHIEYVSDLSE